MYSIIEDRHEIKRLQNKFAEKLRQNLPSKQKCLVGFPGGSYISETYFSEKHNFWYTNKETNSRFWNAFGLGQPEISKSNSLVGEINFPYSGIDRRIGGVFAKDMKGNVVVLHRGKIGGGKKGVGKNLFLENYRGDFISAKEGNQEARLCLVGELSSKWFAGQVGNFISEIARVKQLQNQDRTNLVERLNAFKYTNEKSGVIVKEQKDPGTIDRVHGLVVNELARQLERKGFMVGNDNNRDLFVYSNNRIKALFEIKTSSSTQCLYSAVGQLLVYSIPIEGSPRLIMVMPEKLNKQVTHRLSQLNIEVLYYDRSGQEITFNDLSTLMQRTKY